MIDRLPFPDGWQELLDWKGLHELSWTELAKRLKVPSGPIQADWSAKRGLQKEIWQRFLQVRRAKVKEKETLMSVPLWMRQRCEHPGCPLEFIRTSNRRKFCDYHSEWRRRKR